MMGHVGPAAAEGTPSAGSVVGSLAGRVTNADNHPVPGSNVRVRPWDASSNTWSDDAAASAVTDSNGDFSVTDLPVGRYTAVYGAPYRSGYLDTWRGGALFADGAQAFEVDADHTVIDGSIELILGGSISGRVTGTGGVGLAGARVDLSQDSIGGGLWTGTDDQGNYSATGLYPGRYRLHFEGPWASSWIDTWWEHGADRSESAELEIQPGTALAGIDAQLAAASTISGRLVDTECSQPAPGLSVEAWRLGQNGAWGPAGSRKVDSAGQFTLYGLREGTYRLHIYHSFYDDRGFPGQWWDQVTDQSQARVINLEPEQKLQLGDMEVLKEVPTGSANRDGSRWTLNDTYSVVGETVTVNACRGPAYPPGAVFHWAVDGVPADISGNSYTVGPADLGARISAWVEFSGPGFAPQRRDLGQSLPVQPGLLEAPRGMRLDGTPAIDGESLTLVSQGEWSPLPTQVTYQWLRDGEVLSGQTSPSHQVSAEDFGSTLSLRVTGSRPAYQTVEKTLQAGMVCYPDAAIPDVAVHGIRAVGSTLSVSGGSAGTKMATAYEWRADGRLLERETSSTLRLTKELMGKSVTPTVVGSLSGCAAISRTTSGYIPRIALAPKPRVLGLAKVGTTLRVVRGTWTTGTSFSYRWYSGGKPIPRATKTSLKLTKSLKGKPVTVSVTGKKPGYETVTMTSTSGARIH